MANTAAVFRFPDLGSQPEPKFRALALTALAGLLPGGLPRGKMAEFCGPRSSGKTACCLHVLAEATARGEFCAVVDLQNRFDPVSADAAGVDLSRLIWVRCGGNAEHALRAADLILHAGGFGVVLLDLCDANAKILNRIPLSYWFRFRRAIENTPAIFLLCAETPQAKASSAIRLYLSRKAARWSGKAPARLLRGLAAEAVADLRQTRRVESLFIEWVA
jgi:hypothetical protein